jgi:hypothetical protein
MKPNRYKDKILLAISNGYRMQSESFVVKLNQSLHARGPQPNYILLFYFGGK